MALMRALYDCGGNPVFVPFAFTPLPLIEGADLEQDLAQYHAISKQCFCMPPSSTTLLLAGDDGLRLLLRRADTLERWLRFQAVYHRRHPEIKARLDTATKAVERSVVPFANGARRKLTFSQVVIACAFLAAVPKGWVFRAEAPLPGATGPARCDIELSSGGGRRICRVEIAGMLSRHKPPMTQHAFQYAGLRQERLTRYAKAGLPAPNVIYGDDLFDLPALRASIKEAILPDASRS